MSLLKALVILLGSAAWTTASMAQAVFYPLSYAGRVTDQTGKPLEGTAHLKVSFYRSSTGNDLIAVNPTTPETTEFVQGVFQIPLEIAASDLNVLFADGEEVWVEVKNLDTGMAYQRQRFSVIPYALRVPIDGETIVYDNDGRLKVGTLLTPANAVNFTGSLAGDVTGTQGAAQVAKLQGKTLVATGANDGEFLKFDASTQTWKPGSVSGASGGTVTQVDTGAGLTGGGFTTSGTISIANGGVTDSMLAGSISDGKISSASNWNSAYSERRQWDGGNANLDASAGRASLGLGSLATLSAVGSNEITDGSITNEDISGTAAIDDAKLATISTAGKVSGSAITSGTISGTAGFNATGGVTATANSAASVPMIAKGAASQTGNLLEFRDSNNAVLSAINASGNFSGNALTATTATSATSFTGVLAGDVSGNQGSTQVDKIQGKAIVATGANDGEFLKFDSSTQTWKPGTVSIANGSVTDAMLAGSIPDGKLATISTAGKVSGSAITSGTIGGSTTIATTGTVTASSAAVAGGNITLDNTYALRIKDNGGTATSVVTVTSANNTQLNTPTSGGSLQLGVQNATGTMQFNVNGSNAMTILNDGNVGIGTTTPTAALHVIGSMRIQDRPGIADFLGFYDSSGTRKGYIQQSGNLALKNEEAGGAINLSTGGSPRVWITSTGNVGVGENSPDAKLEVIGDFMVSETASGDGNRFIVHSSGNVGIGTTDPTAKLHVGGTAGVDGIRFPDGTLQTTAAVGGATAIRDQARKLVVQATNSTQVTVTADELILQDSSYNPKRVTAVNVTATITTSGANGLDTGSEAISTWYHVWVINDGTTTAALLSTSATNPTMPAGYTYKAYVSAVYNNASGNFLTFHQRGKRAVLDSYVQVLAAGTQTAFTAVSLSTAVPTTAQWVFGDTGINSSWNSFQQGGVHLAATSGGADTRRYVEYSEPTYTSDQPFDFSMSLRTAQQLYYKCYLKGGGCQSGGVFIRVNGWEFE